MRDSARFVTLPILTLFLALTTVAHAGVTVHHSKSFDFSKVRTFARLKGAPAENEEVERQIHKSIDAQLLAKGLQETDADPDVFVLSLAGGSSANVDDVDILGLPRGTIENRSGDGQAAGGRRQVRIGTLVVLLLDGKTKLQIWQGLATDILSDNPKRSAKKAEKMIGKMFADFPPTEIR